MNEIDNIIDGFGKASDVVENIVKYIIQDQCQKINNFEVYIESQAPDGEDSNLFLYFVHNMIDIELIKATFGALYDRAAENIKKESLDENSKHLKLLIKSSFKDATGEEF